MKFIRAIVCMIAHRDHHMAAVGGVYLHQWCSKCKRDWTFHF